MKLIVDLIYEGGIERMHYSISDTAEYGSHAVGPRVVDAEVRENMRKVLADIRDGSFAREWIAEMENGAPSLAEAREKLAETEIEIVGKKLRALANREVRRPMASVDVPVALLGYGTVGAAVNRLLNEQAEDIERATGHRLRVVKALVRNADKPREFPADDGVLTTDIADVLGDPNIAIVAEVMGGVDPTGEYVLELLRGGKHVVTANKQLVARRGAELFAGGVRRRRAAALRGERVRGDPRDQGAARVARRHERPPRARDRQRHDQLHAHRDGERQELRGGAGGRAGARLRRGRPDRRRLRRGRGREDGDPRHGRLQLALRARRRRGRRHRPDPARRRGRATLDMVDPARRRGAARGRPVDVRVGPALVDRHHPLAAVEGAFNAVMLQGDAIREITLEGPGRRRGRDRVGGDRGHGRVIGTMGTGFLQNDAVLALAAALPAGEHRSPFYFHLSVDDRPGVLARVAVELAERDISIARLLQHQNGDGAALARRHARGARGTRRRGARRDRGAARGASRRCRSPSSPTVASRARS